MDEHHRADLLEDFSKLGLYRKILKTCVCCKHFTFIVIITISPKRRNEGCKYGWTRKKEDIQNNLTMKTGERDNRVGRSSSKRKVPSSAGFIFNFLKMWLLPIWKISSFECMSKINILEAFPMNHCWPRFVILCLFDRLILREESLPR